MALAALIGSLMVGQHAHAAVNAVPGYRRWVDVASELPVDSGCILSTRVRGAVVALAAAPDPTGVGGLYLPDGVKVESWLTCGRADIPRHGEQSLSLSTPSSREELGQAIEAAARIEHPLGRDVCLLSPRLDVRAGVPIATGVSRACEPRGVPTGIGGGP